MAKHAPTLARGYTRAMDHIFDSDDDTPIPELPIVTSPVVTAHPGGISPSSDAAPMAKSAASATRRGSVQPTPPPPAPPCLGRREQNRPHDYAAGTDSVHVQAAGSAKPPPIRTVMKGVVSEQPRPPPNRSERSHKHLKPPHPSWPAAPAPKPAKGCMRDMPEIPSAYVRPPVSKGYHHVSDGAPWRGVAIKEQKRPWPLWERCCRYPTAQLDGDRQALATCLGRGQADNSHYSMRAQGGHVQVPVRQIHVVSRRRGIVAALGNVFAC